MTTSRARIASKTGADRAHRVKSKSKPLSQLRVQAWLNMLFTVKDIERHLRELMSDEFGETLPRLDCLAVLSRAPEGVSMTALSGSLRLTKGNITGLVGRLIRDGLVLREARDGRSAVIALTPRGAGLFSRMAAAHKNKVDVLLGALQERELTGLIDILTRLRRTL